MYASVEVLLHEEADESCIHMFHVLIYAILCLFDLHSCCFRIKSFPFLNSILVFICNPQMSWKVFICQQVDGKIKRALFLGYLKGNLYER